MVEEASTKEDRMVEKKRGYRAEWMIYGMLPSMMTTIENHPIIMIIDHPLHPRHRWQKNHGRSTNMAINSVVNLYRPCTPISHPYHPPHHFFQKSATSPHSSNLRHMNRSQIQEYAISSPTHLSTLLSRTGADSRNCRLKHMRIPGRSRNSGSRIQGR